MRGFCLLLTNYFCKLPHILLHQEILENNSGVFATKIEHLLYLFIHLFLGFSNNFFESVKVFDSNFREHFTI